MSLTLPVPDDETRGLAAELLAGRTLIRQSNERQSRKAPVSNAIEISAYIAGRHPERDDKVRSAIRLNARCRALYHAILREQSVAHVPLARAAASADSDGQRAFKAKMADAEVPGQISLRSSDARPGRVYLAIEIESPLAFSCLALDVPDEHPASEQLDGLRLHFDPPLKGRIELTRSADDPLIAGLRDPGIGIYLMPAP